MPEGPSDLLGRDGALELIRHAMERPRDGRARQSRRRPALLFIGPRGSGKTTLLNVHAARADQRAPCAYIDFDATRADRAYKVLDLLFLMLNMRCGEYGRLAFPRYLVGRRAVDEAGDLDFTDPEGARAALRAALDGLHHPSPLWTFLDRLVGAVVPDLTDRIEAGVGAPLCGAGNQYELTREAIVRDLVRQLVAGLTWWARRRDRTLDEGRAFYGEDHGLNGLLQLSLWHRDGLDRDVDARLLSAFLADLGANFERPKIARRGYNPVILLDNADAPLGERFLKDLLVEGIRQTPAALPLTIIATSRGRLPGRLELSGGATMPEATRLREPEQDGTAESWWCPILLPDLDEHAVLTLVRSRGGRLPADAERPVATMVHQLTNGHPRSTETVLETIVGRPELAWNPRGTFEELRPRLERGLRPGAMSAKALHDLVTVAAGRNQDEAAGLSTARPDLMRSRPGELTTTVFLPELWQDGVLHPMLRRLLGRRLAERANGATWDKVHTWYRDRAIDSGDEPAELYHALALGDLERVARRLACQAATLPAKAWLAAVSSTVRAPSRLIDTDEPADLLETMTAWCDKGELPLAPVARLIAGKWIAADPLTNARRSGLHLAIEAACNDVAPYVAGGFAVLCPEGARHGELALLWKDGDDWPT